MTAKAQIWEQLLKPEIRAFMRDNAQADLPALALKKSPNPEWDYKLVLDQIKARQKAALKFPNWLKHSDIVLPSADIVEQASSAATSEYKSIWARGQTLVDLTGGAGIDCCSLARNFESFQCIDADKNAAALLKHNLPLLCQTPGEIIHNTAENFVRNMPSVDWVYIDPQRRNTSKKGLFRLKDASPDITELLLHLRKKTKFLMLKTSPMLDIHQTLQALQNCMHVHILEKDGECKEVVYILDFSQKLLIDDIPHTAADLSGPVDITLTFTRAGEKDPAPIAQPGKYLFEPGPAFQKSGGFNAIARAFGLWKLHPHTHLYSGNEPNPYFPGRKFEILDILSADHKFPSKTRANLTIRNFPSETPVLRKKLGLLEGGEDTIFACTLADEKKALILCRKI